MDPIPCPACGHVTRALEGRHPDLVALLPHSVLLLGEHQALPGYAVLYSRVHAKELHHLPPADYRGLLEDLRRASAAVESASGCWKLNLASLGNAVPHVHVHLFPRQADDPQRLRHPWVHEARFNDGGGPQERQARILDLRRALEAA